RPRSCAGTAGGSACTTRGWAGSRRATDPEHESAATTKRGARVVPAPRIRSTGPAASVPLHLDRRVEPDHHAGASGEHRVDVGGTHGDRGTGGGADGRALERGLGVLAEHLTEDRARGG